MALEIERKFLVRGEFKHLASKHERIIQGYLPSYASENTIRIRQKGEKAFITIKGQSSEDGTTRVEWEKEISMEDAENLFKLCEPDRIDKIRYYVPVGKFTFEVDVFSGDNEGLILAEIELNSPDEPFEKPQWLGKEVTGSIRYYNSQLIKYPFSKW